MLSKKSQRLVMVSVLILALGLSHRPWSSLRKFWINLVKQWPLPEMTLPDPSLTKQSPLSAVQTDLQ